MQFSVVVPVYNNALTLPSAYQNIVNGFSSFSFSFEIVFVDDGSDDSSLRVLHKLKSLDNRIKIIQLEQNYNQSIAILAGFEKANGKYTIVISADLQEEDEFVRKLIAATEEDIDADLIIGVRKHNSDHLIFKILSRLFYKIIQLKIPKMPSGGFDVGIVSSDLKEKFIRLYYEGIFIQAMVLQLAKKISHVPYHRKQSVTGKIRMKSLYFKLKYFLTSILSVYFPSQTSNRLGTRFYSIKNYWP